MRPAYPLWTSQLRGSRSGVSLLCESREQFTAIAYDQIGQLMAPQPSFTWSVVSGGGSINSSGLYTAPGSAGSAAIQAISGTINASAIVAIGTPSAPTVATSAAALPSLVTGSSTNLSVLGADATFGEAGLTYTWALSSGPASVTFSLNGTNAARHTEVAFTKPGTYTFQVTNGGGRTVTSP
jgi:hypothetical protein